ncbi:hypothetical protein HMPREF9460_01369, partial [Flavonifractor plautii 1_3_50AFAA]
MADYIDAGKLNQPVQVLELRETAPGVWEWVPARRTWASITLQPKTNLFSKVGIGARNAAVIVRRQPLTLHHALRWGDTHLFLTSITPMGRNHLGGGRGGGRGWRRCGRWRSGTQWYRP